MSISKYFIHLKTIKKHHKIDINIKMHLLLCLLLMKLSLTNTRSIPTIDGSKIDDCILKKNYDSYRFLLECPKNGSTQISILARFRRLTIERWPPIKVEINCHVISDEKIYELLPSMILSNVSHVELNFCPMPNDTTINKILNNLGIKQITELTLTTKTSVSLERRHLVGLNSLPRLVIRGPFEQQENSFDDLHELEFLHLGPANLIKLEKGIFKNQKKIRHLYSNGNDLKNVAKDSFFGASSLIRLYLNGENIRCLEADVFEYLPNLIEINLDRNCFIALPNGLLNATKKVELFELNDNCIDLKSLPNGLFSYLPKLNRVQMDGNNLHYLSGDLFLESLNLTYVSLPRNKLTTLPANLFSSQINILGIDLSSNFLTELPGTIFDNTPKLGGIDLSYNQMREISS